MEIKVVNNIIDIEPMKLFRPVISVLLLNAFYSALTLRKLSGDTINSDTESEVWDEVRNRLVWVEGKWETSVKQ